MKAVDLHTHSTKSDGSMTPTELVNYAVEKGLAAIALSDHDTTDGIDEALAAAKGKDIEVIPAIEFSTEYEGRDIHIVGLYIDYHSQEFEKYLQDFRDSRILRNQKMCKKLAEHGVNITYDELHAHYAGSVLTRAHYAAYLMEHGYVKSRSEAFDKYVGDYAPCFVPREKVTPMQAVELILKVGGIPILAHPILYHLSKPRLEKLIQDGRIHPTRIEEMVDKARREVELKIKQEGERAVLETNVHGLNHELVKLLGRLRFRTSYRQNVLNHSIEVAHLAGMMASELGVDANLARRAGLLHDIGKALSYEIEGSHVQIGVDVCKKYKESADVIHAIEAHHGDVETRTVVAALVQAADAISAARPGARRETLESYIKRLENLEQIANSTKGVDKSYAIQAGREIRVAVKPNQVKDDEVPMLAREIAKKIEAELEYPGQIKVNVIRETKATEFAK